MTEWIESSEVADFVLRTSHYCELMMASIYGRLGGMCIHGLDKRECVVQGAAGGRKHIEEMSLAQALCHRGHL